MKTTGVIRRIDELGRIVIPKEIRKSLRIKNGESLEVYLYFLREDFFSKVVLWLFHLLKQNKFPHQILELFHLKNIFYVFLLSKNDKLYFLYHIKSTLTLQSFCFKYSFAFEHNGLEINSSFFLKLWSK